MYAAAGDPGADGAAGTAGVAQTTVVDTAAKALDTVWGVSGTAGTVGGDGTRGQSAMNINMGGSNYNDKAKPGGKGGDGGKGGVSGDSEALNVTVGAIANTDYDFTSAAFGAAGVAGVGGGNGAIGGNGGGYSEGSYTTQPDGGNGGLGGVGGIGSAGANGGVATFTFQNGTSTFVNNTVFGGVGGVGGFGGVGGQGGKGGNAVPAQKEWSDPVEGEDYPNHDGGNGGNGGDGGVGGNGGAGGNGGNAVLTVQGGTVNFGAGTQFGGDGGNGGIGGVGGNQGAKGAGGAAQDPYGPEYVGNPGADGVAGNFGNGGNGGDGGNAGNGSLTVNGGVVNFAGITYFGGVAGNGGAGGAAGGDGASAGSHGVAGAAANGSSVQLNGGTVNLGGDVIYRGNGNSLEINSGASIAYDGNRKVDVGTDGTVTMNGTSNLARTSEAGVLTINAKNFIGSPTTKIVLDVLGAGTTEFFATNVDSGLTADVFDVSGYGVDGAEVIQNGNTFSIQINKIAQTLNWTGNDNTWAVNRGETTEGWSDGKTPPTYKDFTTGDNVNFALAGAHTVSLDGTSVAPNTVKISNGDYTFEGTTALIANTIDVVSGSLTLDNTGTNVLENVRVGSTGVVTANVASSLGNAAVANAGRLNLNYGGIVSNVFSGNGTVDMSGAADLVTLTGDSTDASGTLLVGTAGLQIGDGGTSGNYSGTITDSTSPVWFVTLDRSDNFTFAGNLTDGGVVKKVGDGEMTVTGDNSAAAGTWVSEGTVKVGDEKSLGRFVMVEAGATLDVNGFTPISDTLSVGDGSLVNNNIETESTLNNVVLGDESKIGGSGNLTIGNVLTGNTSLEKIGTGTTTLTGANTYSGGTTITDGTLMVAGTDGTAGTGAVSIGENGTFAANGPALVANDFDGAGKILLLQDSSFTGDFSAYNGNMTVAENQKLIGDFTVTSGMVLDVTATQNQEDAPLQGGTVVVEGELRTTFVDYTMEAGKETQVFVGNDMTGFDATDGSVTTVANRLYKVSQDLQLGDDGSLYYMLKRNFSADLFPNISPQLGPVIDNYQGGNYFIENLMSADVSDEVAGIAVQSSADMMNLAAPMSVIYDTQVGIANAIYNRSQMPTRYSGCGPCDAACGRRSNLEAWVSPIYGNGRGFGMYSGNYRYGYVNDQYAIGFGLEKVQGSTRYGVMGVGGWGKVHSTGSLARTWNDTGFGGVYGYANVKRYGFDLLFSGGWLGMNNDIRQATVGGDLNANMDSGLASFSAILTKTLKFGNLYVMPTFGLEYGYYYQGSTDANWGGQTAFRNERADANLFVLPIGATLKRNMRTANGGLLTPELRARYIANVGDVSSNYNVWMTGSPTSALMATRMTDRNAGDLGIGIGWSRGAWSVRGDYGYMFSEHYQDQYVSVMGSWRF